MKKHICSIYLPTVMGVFGNGEYNQKTRKLWKRIFLVPNFQWATKTRRLVCTFNVKCSKKFANKNHALSLCLPRSDCRSKEWRHPQMISLFLWKSWPSGKQLAYKQDCMQKLKWCLLCSAVADLFNELMEKLLFFCVSCVKHVTEGFGWKPSL